MCFGQNGAKIVSLKGDVRVRRGLEENWINANMGMLLKDIDTILTDEASEVVLEIQEGSRFTLGGQSILDISDLRKITERELFLYLMSQKISRIQSPDQKSKLHIANVSVVRAEKKTSSVEEEISLNSQMWSMEKNGAMALFMQQYYTNAIVKCHKILVRYPSMEDCGQIHFYLGKSFEVIDESGRAIDAYQEVLERSKAASCETEQIQDFVELSSEAIGRLKK